MDTETIRLLAKYNRVTNVEMNRYILTLDPEQWTREFKGYFRSVQSLCDHLYICDFNWLKRFSGLRPFSYIERELFRKEVPFGTAAIAGVDDYTAKREELDGEIDRFAEEVRREDLGRNLSFTDSRGNRHEKPFGGLVLHFFNHQTHHRGMISLYLEHMDIANDYSNLMNLV